jgi:short chain dehydrogenase
MIHQRARPSGPPAFHRRAQAPSGAAWPTQFGTSTREQNSSLRSAATALDRAIQQTAPPGGVHWPDLLDAPGAPRARRVCGRATVNGDPNPKLEGVTTVLSRDAVAIVTGGSVGTGREVALALAGWGWAIVVVYLEHQRTAEAAVAEILAAEGRIVAVRADLADDLDVQRLFAESNAAFAGVDVVVHTTPDSASLLYQHAARHVRRRGAIVSVSAADGVTPGVAPQLRERGISVGRAPPDEVLSFLDSWRRQAIG